MIKSVVDTALYALLSAETNIVYHIPPYQREYSWSKDQWDALFDDLLEEDAGDGHFLGTIICVNATEEATSQTVLELVDGQQRMSTLSLLLLAIYRQLKARSDDFDEDQSADFVNLRKMLILGNPVRARIRLQKQNHNLNDYLVLLQQSGFEIDAEPTTYLGNRRIARALSHFTYRISERLNDDPRPNLEVLFDLLGRAKQSILVKLEVANHSDAFVLFESLNNRGLPLTPIDLIKTSLLSVADKTNGTDVSSAYKEWSAWLESLGDDYGNQERFFRQFYNAFKTDWDLSVPGVAIAYRSKLIRVYEELLKGDLAVFFERMSIATNAYARILGRATDNEKRSSLDAAIENLSRAQGRPAYMLVLFLLVHQERFELKDKDLVPIVELMTKFFVRRNLTNTPPTYDLDRLFISVIEKVPSLPAGEMCGFIRDSLLSVSASDDDFNTQLRGPIYEENVAVARFILVAMARASMTKESFIDLWARDKVGESKTLYVWTVEHVLPQGENLPQGWVDMLGGSDQAREVQGNLVHTLGNLSITGYNSALGNKSFEEKRDRKDKSGNPVGYRNGISLNDYIVKQKIWGAEQILERTEILAGKVFNLFKF